MAMHNYTGRLFKVLCCGFFLACCFAFSEQAQAESRSHAAKRSNQRSSIGSQSGSAQNCKASGKRESARTSRTTVANRGNRASANKHARPRENFLPQTPPPPQSCTGDLNSDGVVDVLDLILFNFSFGCSSSNGSDLCKASDLNQDGIVDPLDKGLLTANLGACSNDDTSDATCDGDLNGDGAVDPLDIGFVTQRLDCQLFDPPVSGCEEADLNKDGLVNPLDSGYLLARLGSCQK